MNIEEIKNNIMEDLNAMKTENNSWLNTKELANYLKISIQQLEGWRRESFGPKKCNCRFYSFKSS